MRATWLVDVLRDAGLTVHPYNGWETRGGSEFNPAGVIIHHTVTKPTSSDAAVDRMLAVKGSSKVPPPLCNYSTNRDGTVSVVAAGTANHGGVGVWRGVSGNRFWFGDEMKNLGTKAEPWPQVQLEAARVAAAAILVHLDRTADWVCGHKEYATPPGRKVDPHSLNMDGFRRDVAAEMETLMSRFKDVPDDHTHARAIEWAAEVGITRGVNKKGDLFAPDRPVTRGEMATFLKRLYDRMRKD